MSVSFWFWFIWGLIGAMGAMILYFRLEAFFWRRRYGNRRKDHIIDAIKSFQEHRRPYDDAYNKGVGLALWKASRGEKREEPK